MKSYMKILFKQQTSYISTYYISNYQVIDQERKSKHDTQHDTFLSKIPIAPCYFQMMG